MAKRGGRPTRGLSPHLARWGARPSHRHCGFLRFRRDPQPHCELFCRCETATVKADLLRPTDGRGRDPACVLAEQIGAILRRGIPKRLKAVGMVARFVMPGALPFPEPIPLEPETYSATASRS